MKKFYIIIFLSLIISLTLSVRFVSTGFFNSTKSSIKSELDKEKLEADDDEREEIGNLITTEFILTQLSEVIFLKLIKVKFVTQNIFLPLTYFQVPKQPPKSLYFFE